MKNPDFFNSLKEKLNTHHQFPLVYMFKFIIPADNQKIASLHALFDEKAQISLRASSKGKFSSITVRAVMINAEEVIQKYQEAAQIPGLIAL
ncbi:MAG: DUF493 family protein [Bacteroidota bacterium]